MDSERVILVACVTAMAAVVGTFVLWGPSIPTRPKKKNFVIGLQNLGLTCYLNSLLQAMASCRYFVEWLNTQQNQGQVASATKELLNVLCGKSTSLSEEYFVSPVSVVTALSQNGWKITNSQQDVHELLCNFVTILEEEAHKSCVDLMMAIDVISAKYMNDEESTTSRVTNFASCNSDHCTNGDETSTSSRGIHCEGDAFVSDECNSFGIQIPRRCGKRKKHDGRSKPYVAHDINQSPRPSPFRGYLTNKLECLECSYESALRYDKFDCISLHLPERTDQSAFTLGQLLSNFVKDEVICDIMCEECHKNRSPNTEVITSSAVKMSRFGKLPPCLCIHIVRTSFQEYGVYKRQDYVDFPEYIAMDQYLHKARKKDTSVPKQNPSEITSNGDAMVSADAVNDRVKILKSNSAKYLYRLKAVIVHRGSHNDGHFMTYRRGNSSMPKTQHRWFLVSDAEVKETTLYNVLESVAYVLFYEKFC